MRLAEDSTGVFLGLAEVGFGFKIVLIAKAFEEEERENVRLVILPGGLAAENIGGPSEPGFKFLLRQHAPERHASEKEIMQSETMKGGGAKGVIM